MRIPVVILASILALQGVTEAGTISVDWSSAAPRTAIGTLDGVTVAATTSEAAHFSADLQPFDPANWQAQLPLPKNTPMLIVEAANGDDSHTFLLTEPTSNILLYIENFDSNSAAMISVEGTDLGGIELLSASSSVSYQPVDSLSGVLSTINGTSDGEGDAILQFVGTVRSISLDYSAGDGANGVFYTLVVPESSAGMGFMLGTVMLVPSLRRRRVKWQL